MTITKSIADLGKATRFGADWPGERCGAKTRRGTECQRPAYKRSGRCGLHGGKSTGAKTYKGLQSISKANMKHGKYTTGKLETRRRAAEVGRQIRTELKLIEQRFVKAGLLYR